MVEFESEIPTIRGLNGITINGTEFSKGLVLVYRNSVIIPTERIKFKPLQNFGRRELLSNCVQKQYLIRCMPKCTKYICKEQKNDREIPTERLFVCTRVRRF